MSVFQFLNFPAIPEISLLITISMILLLEIFMKQKADLLSYSLSQIGLLIGLGLNLHLRTLPTQYLFHQHFIWDRMVYCMNSAVLIFSLFCFIYSRNTLKNKLTSVSEYYLLSLFSVLGMCVLISSNSLLTLYLGLELLSFPLYALVALQRRSSNGAEAAIKYFILGSLASGLLLYGLSLIYGYTHSLIIPVINHFMDDNNSYPLFLIIGLCLSMVGIVFKIGAAPFQFWVPDVYQGAPIPVTLFISAAPKVAGLALAIHLLVEAFPHLYTYWWPSLATVSILSFSLGNLLAIVQTNLKRMLAYSAIAHMGYALLGLVAGTKLGYAMSLFYVFVYGLMALSAFAVLMLASQSGREIELVSDLKGLNTRKPWLAFLMLLTLFSMAGIPPTVGFFAKLGVLQALIEVNQLWVATLAIIFAIIGAYYYLYVIKIMYFEAPDPTLRPLAIPSMTYLALSINAILLLVLGLFPGQLLWLAKSSFFTINYPVY